MKDLLRRAAAATEPSPAQVERLRRRLAWPGALLRGSGRLDRVAAPAPRRLRPRVLLVLAGSALAALLLVARPPRPLDLELEDEVQLSPQVRLQADGAGHAGGTTAAPRLRWEAGDLDVDVVPHQGVDLRITTPEAEVQVVGTAFSLRRDALGTRVRVQRGEVRVACASGDEHRLLATDEHTCLPTRPAALLGRARALRSQGADPAAVLATLDAGLARAEGADPVALELRALRIETLARAGRGEEARAAARAWLDSGEPSRRDQVQALLDALDRGD